ncbi:MAG: PKD domain-containing protein, partial [Candidatus Methanoperedens sp.]|nr:PKD domain-containing protein [Candidatus Methanoperedens sp.]
FASQSTGDIQSFAWDFGDGGTSADVNPLYTYIAPGTYSVTLTVTGSGGSNSSQSTITVNAPAPIAAFTSDVTTGTAPLSVQFASQSTGDIQSFAWDFGDGSTSADVNPAYTYAMPGTYTVTLTVTGSGGSNNSQATITVSAAAPIAAFASDVTTGTAPLTVQFINQSTGDIQAYAWDFGDGGTSADVNAAYTYTAPGTYTVTLTVTGIGGTASSQSTITVNAGAPVATFASDVTDGEAPLTVQFTDQSTGDIQAYTWDFGDGGTSADVNPAYTYTAPGTYTVTLTVTGTGGSTSSQATITVNEPALTIPSTGIVDTTSIIPDLTVELVNRLRAIYDAGIANGNRASVFAIAGDDYAVASGYLDPFAAPGGYFLDGGSGTLQGIIDWYNLTDLGGNTSFNHAGVARRAGWTAADLV